MKGPTAALVTWGKETRSKFTDNWRPGPTSGGERQADSVGIGAWGGFSYNEVAWGWERPRFYPRAVRGVAQFG